MSKRRRKESVEKSTKKNKMECTVKDRYSKNVAYIDTGHPDVGIIENPFKGVYRGTGEDVKEWGTFFEDIDKCICQTLDTFYKTYGKENVYLLGCIAWISDAALIKKIGECAGCILIANDEYYGCRSRESAIRNLAFLPKIKVPFKEIFAFAPNKILKTFDNTVDLEPKTTEEYMGNLGLYGPLLTLGTRPINPENPSLFQNGRRQHSKYIIICVWFGQDHEFVPVAVMSGSYNYTEQAKLNQENVIYMSSIPFAKSYYEDFVNSFQAAKPVRI